MLINFFRCELYGDLVSYNPAKNKIVLRSSHIASGATLNVDQTPFSTSSWPQSSMLGANSYMLVTCYNFGTDLE
jgi:hypothetical protein